MLIYQSSHGYCYNSDSIFLIWFISRFAPKGRLLDVGCGVGVVGLVLSREFELNATIVDIQKHMIEYAKHNYVLNKIPVDAHEGDFLDLDLGSGYDVIVSNPPFYGDSVIQSKKPILNLARYASAMPFEKICHKVHRLLRPQGRFYFCYDAKQIGYVLCTLEKYHLRAEVIEFVHSNIKKESKLVLIACRHHSKANTKIASPFIVFDKDGEYTKEAKKAFLFASLHSIKGERYDDITRGV